MDKEYSNNYFSQLEDIETLMKTQAEEFISRCRAEGDTEYAMVQI